MKKIRNYEIMYKFIDSTKPKSVFPFYSGCVYGGNKEKKYALLWSWDRRRSN